MRVKRCKRCTKCGKLLSLDCFYYVSRSITRRRSWCIKCSIKHNKDLYTTEEGRLLQRKYGHTALLKKYYKMTQNQYDKRLQRQGGVCAICGRLETHRRKGMCYPCELSVDHNHRTGRIRGLLCHECNSKLIGGIEGKNAVFVLKKALKYVKKWDIT